MGLPGGAPPVGAWICKHLRSYNTINAKQTENNALHCKLSCHVTHPEHVKRRECKILTQGNFEPMVVSQRLINSLLIIINLSGFGKCGESSLASFTLIFMYN